MPMIAKNPAMNITAIMAYVKEKYNYTISYKKAWNAKQKAIGMIFGDWDASYTELPKFMAAIQQYNPGTIVKWLYVNGGSTTEKNFERVF